MPLCHKHHVIVHQVGLNSFIIDGKKHNVNGDNVVAWLIENGWYFDDYMSRWVNPREF